MPGTPVEVQVLCRASGAGFVAPQEWIVSKVLWFQEVPELEKRFTLPWIGEQKVCVFVRARGASRPATVIALNNPILPYQADKLCEDGWKKIPHTITEEEVQVRLAT